MSESQAEVTKSQAVLEFISGIFRFFGALILGAIITAFLPDWGIRIRTLFQNIQHGSLWVEIGVYAGFTVLMALFIWLSTYKTAFLNRWGKVVTSVLIAAIVTSILAVFPQANQPSGCLTAHSLNNVAILSEDSAWAVGYQGTILGYAQAQWCVYQSPTSTTLTSLAMVSPRDGWAATVEGVVYHFNGNQWSEYESVFPGELTSISMVSEDEGWAVGGNSVKGAIIHFYDGAWQDVTDSSGDLSNLILRSVAFPSPTEGWAVGQHGSEAQGAIWQYHNGRWVDWVAATKATKATKPLPHIGRLNSIAMITPTRGWAVGDDGTIIYYNGLSWVPFASPTHETLMSVAMLPSGMEGWAVGANSTVLHFMGGTWHVMKDVNGVPPTLLASVAVSPTSAGSIAWAVGGDGLVLQYANGRGKQVAS